MHHKIIVSKHYLSIYLPIYFIFIEKIYLFCLSLSLLPHMMPNLRRGERAYPMVVTRKAVSVVLGEGGQTGAMFGVLAKLTGVASSRRPMSLFLVFPEPS